MTLTVVYQKGQESFADDFLALLFSDPTGKQSTLAQGGGDFGDDNICHITARCKNFLTLLKGGAMSKRHKPKQTGDEPGCRYIYRPWRKTKDGKILYAKHYGLKAWKIPVDE